MKKRILLGITSSIAAYKALDLVKKLQNKSLNVQVIMTKNAVKIITPSEFNKVGVPIYTDLFPKGFDYKKVLSTRQVEHIQLADSTDVFAIVPATANTIAKLATGIADDLLTTTALAFTKPLIIAPAMNTHMWTNPLVRKNITRLKALGHTIVEPTEGMLACGYEGQGKLENTDIIVQAITQQVEQSQKLLGKKIIVTAGGTTEPIDNVRVITNKSSGKMGVALAESLYLQGAEVLLLRGKNAVKSRFFLKEATFITSKDLLNLLKSHVPSYDGLFHAAAVSDFSVTQKNSKLSSKTSHTLTLIPQQKIVEKIKELNPNIQLFAFKAVDNEKDLLKKAQELLRKSHAEAIIANDISKRESGFESNNNEVLIVKKNGETKKVPYAAKKDVAKEIINFLL